MTLAVDPYETIAAVRASRERAERSILFADAEGAAAGSPSLVLPDLAGFHELRIWAETYEDQQDHRKRVMNRLGLKADGSAQSTGTRVPPELFAGQVEAIQRAEHLTALAMRRAYRRVAPPAVIEWQKSTFGIGEHLLARLLGALGHPRIATPYHWEGEGSDRVLISDPAYERTLRQLWSYCGHGDPARRKAKGMTADQAMALGSPRAKMLVHLLAEASMKCRPEPSPESAAMPVGDAAGPISDRGVEPGGLPTAIRLAADSTISGSGEQPMRPTAAARAGAGSRRYRSLYDSARTRYDTREDWTPGHRHAAALRLVGKEILRDLWVVSDLALQRGDTPGERRLDVLQDRDE